MTTTKLDDISTALEQAVKSLRAGAATPTKKRMTLDEFMTFALTQLQKAAKDDPATAKRRLVALKRSVDDVIAGVAKMSAEDAESEDVKVEVTTAFAPTKADGDTPMDDLTTAADQSSTEVDVETVTSASGDSALAENLGQVAKALQKLKEDLGPTTGDQARARSKKRRDSEGEDGHPGNGKDREAANDRERDPDGWPLDLASDEFLKGNRAAENDPIWGYDPAGVASKDR
jgi:hypothetical protein